MHWKYVVSMWLCPVNQETLWIFGLRYDVSRKSWGLGSGSDHGAFKIQPKSFRFVFHTWRDIWQFFFCVIANILTLQGITLHYTGFVKTLLFLSHTLSFVSLSLSNAHTQHFYLSITIDDVLKDMLCSAKSVYATFKLDFSPSLLPNKPV